jgi:fatty acid desaturase
VPVYSAVMFDVVKPPVDMRSTQSATPQNRQQKLIVSAIRAGAIVAFLGAINLFSWHGHFWFQWPSLAVLLVFALRATHLYRG